MNPQFVKNINNCMEKLKNYITDIKKILPTYNTFCEIDETIEKLLTWIDKFKDEKQPKNKDDFKTRDDFITKIKAKLNSIYKDNNQITEIIKYSQGILDNPENFIDINDKSLSAIDKENAYDNFREKISEDYQDIFVFINSINNDKKISESQNDTNINIKI